MADTSNSSTPAATTSSTVAMGSELPMAPNMTVRPQPPTISAPNTSANPNGASRKKAHQKDSGVSKATKPSSRAKSGCYTCRIRRKKCDEKPNVQGACETCVRLRLQCLGFGAKRPEWLRSQQNVTELRNRIKDFLAAQGMIKGHATGNRAGSDMLPAMPGSADPQNPILDFDINQIHPQPALLSLEDPVTNPRVPLPVMPSAPQHMVLEVPSAHHSPSPPSNGEGVNYRTIQTSSIRETTTDVLDPALASASTRNSSNHPASPADAHGYHSCQPISSLSSSVNSSLVPSSLSKSQDFVDNNGVLRLAIVLPSLEGLLQIDDTENANTYPMTQREQPGFTQRDWRNHALHLQDSFIPRPLPLDMQKTLKQHYFNYVVGSQYILSDKNLVRAIIHDLMKKRIVWEAVSFLSSISWNTLRDPASTNAVLFRNGTNQLQQLQDQMSLVDIQPKSKAVAAILAISAILFIGGRCSVPAPYTVPQSCPCSSWFSIIAVYITSILGEDPSTIRAMFSQHNVSDQWIILTGIWFDVLSSITTGGPPKLEKVIDALWNPNVPQSSYAPLVDYSPGSGSETAIPSPLYGTNDQQLVFGNIQDSPDQSFNRSRDSTLDTHSLPPSSPNNTNFGGDYISTPMLSNFQQPFYQHHPIELSSAPHTTYRPLHAHPLPQHNPNFTDPDPYHTTPPPYFAPEMYNPPAFFPYASSSRSPPQTRTPLSMFDGMGASAISVSAISQTQCLLQWSKYSRSSRIDLHKAGQAIINQLEQHSPPERDVLFDMRDGGSCDEKRDLQVARDLTSRVWDATALLNVTAVLEDNRSGVHNIRCEVDRTMVTLRNVNAAEPGTDWRSTSLPVVRNLFFPLFLCGALTMEKTIRDEIEGMLRAQCLSPQSVGNAKSVLSLLQAIWVKYDRLYRDDRPIPWRDELRQSHLLLI